MRASLFITRCFSFANFKIIFVFNHLLIVFIDVNLFVFILLGLCASWTWMSVSFPRLEKFSAIISSVFFFPLFSLFLFWEPYNMNANTLDVPEALKISSFFELVFSSFHLVWVISTTLSSSLVIIYLFILANF